jgi:uncharacterized protein YggE
MKTRFFILGALMTLVLLVSACGPTTVNQAAPPPVRSLSVSGNGEAHLAPDIAFIYIGVHTEKLTAAEAVAENTTQTEAVIEAIREFGIAEEDIRTMNFSIWPIERYDPQTGQPTGEKTYAVDNTVYVTVCELDTLGDLIDTAIQAGANTVNSVQFDVEDKDAALQAARAEAVQDAQAKAQELAEASGVTLGELQTINFIDSPMYPIFDGKGGGGASEVAAAVPIQPGQLTFTVTVNVTYLID